MGVCAAELLELDHGSIQFFAVACAVDLVRFRIRGVAGFLLNQAHLQSGMQQLKVRDVQTTVCPAFFQVVMRNYSHL